MPKKVKKAKPPGKKQPGKKLRIAFFSFTGDEGCMINVLESFNSRYRDWFPLLDVKAFRILQKKAEIKDLDVAVIEGAISTYSEEKKLKEIRKNSKKLVALGACAIDGGPSAQRNRFDEERRKEIKFILEKFRQRPKVTGLNAVVKVDATVRGCPVDEDLFIQLVDSYLKEFGVVG